MRNFILFGGNDYYPSGGWGDYKGSFETIDEAVYAMTNQNFDWWHVVDVELDKIIAGSRQREVDNDNSTVRFLDEDSDDQ